MALHRYGDFRVEVFYFDSPCTCILSSKVCSEIRLLPLVRYIITKSKLWCIFVIHKRCQPIRLPRTVML